MKTKRKSGKNTPAARKRYEGFSDAERSAMQARVEEMKVEKAAADGETALLAKIAEMKEPDLSMEKRLHAIVKATDPTLTPTTYYGMPAYARNGKSVFWFKPAGKFKSRYATLEFGDTAKLDEGTMWPVSFALAKMTAGDEATIKALIKKAAG